MKTNALLAVWSLILGILAVISCGPITGIPAIICGHMAKAKIKMAPDTLTGDGMALAGLIMGYFSIVVFILLIFAAILLAIMVPSIINILKDMSNSPAPQACDFFINMLSSLA